MEDLKPIMFVVIDGDDLIQDQIEIDEKPAITQDLPTKPVDSPQVEKKKRRHKKNLKFTCVKQRQKPQSSHLCTTQLPIKTEPSNIKEEVDFVEVSNTSGNEPLRGRESVLNCNNKHNKNNIQITSVVSKAESFFNSENNNDSVSTISSGNDDESEIFDPLQNLFNLETNENGRKEIIDNNEKNNFNSLETDIRLFTPYIRKLCVFCKKISELKTASISNQKCNNCKKLVTKYCCSFCLKVKSLTDMYIHIFKCHYDETTSSDLTIQNIPESCFACGQCGARCEDKDELREHESSCSVSANLFCRYCLRKLRLKREMREHMIKEHRKEFEMSELESILNEIVCEADAVMSLLLQHSGHCPACKKHTPINPPIELRSTHCFTCSTKLVYYCSDPGSRCSSQPFTKLSSLQLHLRYHANKGWTSKKILSGKVRVCHLCSYKDERPQLRAHMTSKHSDIVHCKCDLCGTILKNVSVWKKHQAKYCPVTHQKLQCGHCWFRCFRKKRLRRHLKSVHTHLYTGKRPRCNKCGITWAGLYRLRWHESRCSGDAMVERAKQKEVWAMRGVVFLS